MILIIGAGAVGTVLAAQLAKAGREVALYTREKDREVFDQLDFVKLDFPSGKASPVRTPVPPRVTALTLEGVDYLLICVKFGALEALMDLLPEQIPPRCTLVNTLNGVEPLRMLRARWPDANVVPLSIMMNSQLLAPLHAELTTRAEMIIGAQDKRLLTQMSGLGIDVKMADGDEAVWGKLLINLANAVCTLTQATFKDLFIDPDLRKVYVAILDEATASMNAAGLAWKLPLIVPYSIYRWMLLRAGKLPWWFAKYRNGVGEGAYPSMVSDFRNGRSTEVRQLNGEIVRLGQQIGIETPVNAKIVEMVELTSAAQPLSFSALRAALNIA